MTLINKAIKETIKPIEMNFTNLHAVPVRLSMSRELANKQADRTNKEWENLGCGFLHTHYASCSLMRFYNFHQMIPIKEANFEKSESHRQSLLHSFPLPCVPSAFRLPFHREDLVRSLPSSLTASFLNISHASSSTSGMLCNTIYLISEIIISSWYRFT